MTDGMDNLPASDDWRAVLDGRQRWAVVCADCLNVLATMPDESVDAVVTDPPAGIAFMGKAWDRDKGGRTAWVAWLASVMAECLRVLKPGGHAVVWALPRTAHWTGCALEDAGFEVRDCLTHHFGSGFPKSLDMSKAIDVAAGAERPIIGRGASSCPDLAEGKPCRCAERTAGFSQGATVHSPATAPVTPEAVRWYGWGTALKPATEFWWLCRKPLVGTVVANVQRYGTGGLNVDGCRTSTRPEVPGSANISAPDSQTYGGDWNKSAARRASAYRLNPPLGRWPANLVLSHSPDCRCVGTRKVAGDDGHTRHASGVTAAVFGQATPHSTAGHGNPDGTETVEAWECAPGCPVAELDRQSGAADDTGGASRFFYCAKADTAEREKGCEHLPLPESTGHNLSTNACARCGKRIKANGSGEKCECGDLRETVKLNERRNTHPTVKPVALMQWLVRLVTPPQGVVLDPFTGSGTTGIAAFREGFRFVGIEREAEYAEIARARIEPRGSLL